MRNLKGCASPLARPYLRLGRSWQDGSWKPGHATFRKPLSRDPMDLTLVPPAGFEPAHMASEANALSPELRERLLAHRNPVVPGNCHGAS